MIKNLYLNIKSCISLNGKTSSFFCCNCGVRQGENLSPLLFSLFLNDLEQYLENKGHSGINFNDLEHEVDTFLKILLLLCADDTVLVGDEPTKLQNCLNDFAEYCKTWKLKINVSKTKVLVFGSHNDRNISFKINDIPIEVTTSYKYLGVLFSKSGSFLNARKYLATQAKKAMNLLYKRIYNLFLPLDLALKLFDNTVLPIFS